MSLEHLEHEMNVEISKLEDDIGKISEEIRKFELKIAALKGVRTKKEHDLRILKETTGMIPTTTEEIQLTFNNMKIMR